VALKSWMRYISDGNTRSGRLIDVATLFAFEGRRLVRCGVMATELETLAAVAMDTADLADSLAHLPRMKKPALRATMPMPNSPLLMIINEAKSVPDGIFDAFSRCSYSTLLEISTGGLMQGWYYEHFTTKRGAYKWEKDPCTLFSVSQSIKAE
jgi:hypothetical protein